MKTAVVSDIHGNLDALEAVLADIKAQEVDRIFCLGDVVGYGPNPRECVDIVRTFDLCILGNHDQAALFDPEGFSHGAEQAIFWTRRQLETGDNEEETLSRWHFLCELPRTYTEKNLLFVHGSARNPLCEYVFPEDIYNPKKLEKIFSLIPNVCFQGHTHVPGVFYESAQFVSPNDFENDTYQFNGEKVMINVGSVGQPRDGDPRSCYVIVDEKSVQFRRVAYPIEKVADKIRDIDDLDDSQGDRLFEGH
ncbi:metallophosphoesterase family protein [Blastopirellula marina]|uniref:Phosphoesterase n=1 Tax=Blastopirellula marina TaxID=124 RepID=A0A2S8GDX0_9BACT|nr:metallophosphoesterase family protein [Blastopirellula marina]PQO42639.1 phosphoesterase [Blastopirellula marina]PTL46405.1 metallophosphoesterase [Blastopirellula marina]